MNPEQLQAIRKRLSLGSEGAWVKTGDWVRADGVPVVECIHGNSEQAEADADLIAHAPTDLRALLDEVERLKAREESLVQQSVAQIGMIGRLQEEVERLKAEVAVLRGTFCEEACEIDGETMTRDRCGVCRKCAYRRGAEAMREAAVAAARFALTRGFFVPAHVKPVILAIRDLPIPEDKP